MPYLFGEDTQTIILKSESHKLHQEFDTEDNTAFIVFDDDLIALNEIDISVNGVAIATVTYGVSHDATMAAIATALEVLASVASAEVFGATNRRIKVIAEDAPITVIVAAVTLGATQANTAVSYNENRFAIGRPAVIVGNQLVAPAQIESTTQDIIGYAINVSEDGGQVVIAMKAYAIIFAQCENAGHLAGPCHLGAASVYNVVDGYVYIDDVAAINGTNHLGWALEGGDADDIVRLALL